MVSSRSCGSPSVPGNIAIGPGIAGLFLLSVEYH
jgi:hypothetical protein